MRVRANGVDDCVENRRLGHSMRASRGASSVGRILHPVSSSRGDVGGHRDAIRQPRRRGAHRVCRGDVGYFFVEARGEQAAATGDAGTAAGGEGGEPGGGGAATSARDAAAGSA